MRFIGSKRNLLDFIYTEVEKKTTRKDKIFCDLFSGTGVVGKFFKEKGYAVISNDILYFSFVLQKAQIATNKKPSYRKLLSSISAIKNGSVGKNGLEKVIDYLNKLPPRKGFIYENYSPGGKVKRKYFTADNAGKIDAVRDKLEIWTKNKLLSDQEYFVLLSSLIEAVPFVSNISGTYGAYLKDWDKRANKMLTLEVPIINTNSSGHVSYNLNGTDLLDDISGDVLYLDPPYNERQYAPNYHILESIAVWDKPKISGVAGLRPYLNQKSNFCLKDKVYEELEDIIKKARFKNIFLSYNEEGLMKKDKILKIMKKYGKSELLEKDYRRYKSNSNGSNRLNVKEQLYYLQKIR